MDPITSLQFLVLSLILWGILNLSFDPLQKCCICALFEGQKPVYAAKIIFFAATKNFVSAPSEAFGRISLKYGEIPLLKLLASTRLWKQGRWKTSGSE
jgi:hypothetical protein